MTMHPDQPLTDKEFQELDSFLLSDRCAEDGMTMDALHGFLTALVIGPEQVPMSEWLPIVWGSAGSQGPAFKNEKERDRIIKLIARFMNEIAITFEVAPKEFEPLVCEHVYEGKTLVDADAWAWGFWEGMNLCSEAWSPIFESPLEPQLRPIHLLGAEEIEESEMSLVDDPLKRHRLAIEMEAAIPHIHRFWLENRKPAAMPVQRQAPKTGRNEPCPCGSGKKFKSCCGGSNTLH